MRPLALVLMAAVFGACADGPADAPAPLLSEPAPASPAPPEAPAPDLRTDSLLRDEPALRYTVRIGYPQVEGDGPAVAAVNAAIRDTVAALADDFRPAEPPPEYDSPAYVVEVDGGAERTFVDGHVLSTLIEVYAYTGGAHGNTFFLPLTYRLDTGDPVDPASLFAEGTAWGDTLAARTERSVLRQLAVHGTGDARQSFFAEGLGPIRQGDVFATLGRDSLFVHIPPYQLSAYAAGSFHVGVPYGALRSMARSGSPLARLASE